MDTNPQPPSTYPQAPWNMVGQLWLSLFRLREPVDALRPAGTYGVAFVSYEEGSPLTYSELLVARPVKEPTKAVSITDIWVDSAASVAGGRELWAIPKGLCEFDRTRDDGLVSRNRWSASIDGRPVAEARFGDVSRFGVRLPFKGATWQPGLDEGIGAHQGPKTATLKGSSRTLPCRGSWTFDPDGPLAWLAARRPVASFRMSAFRMSFG